MSREPTSHEDTSHEPSSREDTELRAWMDDWQSAGPAAEALPEESRAAILHRVKRRTAELRLLLAGEMLLGLGAFGFLLRFAARNPQPLDRALAAGLALFCLAALLFSLWSYRGLWSPADETAAAYLALARRRARRRLDALRAAWWLLAGETLLFLPWIWYRLHLPGGGTPTVLRFVLAYGYLALVVGAVAACLAWSGRRARRELADLDGRG